MAAKATKVNLGFFKRAGRATAGFIGDIRATWDRHRGGALTIGAKSVSAGPIALATRVRVTRAGRAIVLDQQSDPDPRLIVVEQGPQRIVMRVMFSLLDGQGGQGGYHGDGLTETHIYSDGEVRLAFAFRLIDARMHDAVTDAWVEMNVGGECSGATIGATGARAKKLRLDKPAGFAFRRQLPGRFVALAGRKGGVAAGYYSLDGRATDALGGVGQWHGPGDRAPWYDTWGHLYEQWDGLAGWGGHPTGRLVFLPPPWGEGRGEGTERSEEVCGSGLASADLEILSPHPLLAPGGGGSRPSLRWHWLNGANERCGANFGCKALLAIYFDRDATAAADRLTQSFDPVVPRSTQGLQFRCLDVVENVLLFKLGGTGSLSARDNTGRQAARATHRMGCEGLLVGQAEFGPTRTARLVRARVFGLDAFAGTRVRAAGRVVPAQRLSAGGMTDDPYGTNLARPGDRFVPLIGSENDARSEAVFSFPLPARRLTRVRVEQTAGLAMDYLKYDDREIYLLRSAAVSRSWPIAAFSVRTLSLHNLRLAGTRAGSVPPPAAVRVPLYWYPTNVQTRGHCANELVKLAISSDVWSGAGGPIRLAVQSTTPNRTILSRVEAEINRDSHHLFPCSDRAGFRINRPNIIGDCPYLFYLFGGRPSLLVNVCARLEVLTQFDMPEIQFLNLFPYDSWRTEDWESDWVISLDDAGRATTCLIKEPYDKRRFGDQPQAWGRAFFLAQGPRDRGNLFLLARSAGLAKPSQKHRHVLCRVWSDSHLGVHGLPTPVPAGTKLAVDYTLAIGGGRSLSMAEAFEIGRAAMKSGELRL